MKPNLMLITMEISPFVFKIIIYNIIIIGLFGKLTIVVKKYGNIQCFKNKIKNC
jgi:hypothetical protein